MVIIIFGIDESLASSDNTLSNIITDESNSFVLIKYTSSMYLHNNSNCVNTSDTTLLIFGFSDIIWIPFLLYPPKINLFWVSLFVAPYIK